MKKIIGIFVMTLLIGTAVLPLIENMATVKAYHGDVIDSFNSPGMTPMGLAWDGQYLWNADLSDDLSKIYKLDPSDGSILNSFDSPGDSPGGLAWDGTNLWNIDHIDKKIYQITTDGTILGYLPSPGDNPEGLTLDDCGCLMYVGNNDISGDNDEIYKIDLATGMVIDSFDSPGIAPMGLAWDGQYLWNADIYDGKIYKIHPSNGIILDSFYSPGEGPTGLTWDGQYLWNADNANDSIYKIETDKYYNITLENVEVLDDGRLRIIWNSTRYDDEDIAYSLRVAEGDFNQTVDDAFDQNEILLRVDNIKNRSYTTEKKDFQNLCNKTIAIRIAVINDGGIADSNNFLTETQPGGSTSTLECVFTCASLALKIYVYYTYPPIGVGCWTYRIRPSNIYHYYDVDAHTANKLLLWFGYPDVTIKDLKASNHMKDWNFCSTIIGTAWGYMRGFGAGTWEYGDDYNGCFPTFHSGYCGCFQWPSDLSKSTMLGWSEFPARSAGYKDVEWSYKKFNFECPPHCGTIKDPYIGSKEYWEEWLKWWDQIHNITVKFCYDPETGLWVDCEDTEVPNVSIQYDPIVDDVWLSLPPDTSDIYSHSLVELYRVAPYPSESREDKLVAKIDFNCTEKLNVFSLNDEIVGFYNVTLIFDNGWKMSKIFLKSPKEYCFKSDFNAPEIEIIKPKNALYLFDKEIITIPFALILGSITVRADAIDEESGINGVDFYIDDKIFCFDSSAPYECNWDKTAFGKHTIKVKAYDFAENMATDEVDIIIFNI